MSRFTFYLFAHGNYNIVTGERLPNDCGVCRYEGKYYTVDLSSGYYITVSDYKNKAIAKLKTDMISNKLNTYRQCENYRKLVKILDDWLKVRCYEPCNRRDK